MNGEVFKCPQRSTNASSSVEVVKKKHQQDIKVKRLGIMAIGAVKRWRRDGPREAGEADERKKEFKMIITFFVIGLSSIPASVIDKK